MLQVFLRLQSCDRGLEAVLLPPGSYQILASASHSESDSGEPPASIILTPVSHLRLHATLALIAQGQSRDGRTIFVSCELNGLTYNSNRISGGKPGFQWLSVCVLGGVLQQRAFI